MILFFSPYVLSLLAGFGHLCRFLFSKLYERIRENQINREVHDAAMEAEVVVEVRENLPDKTHAASYVEAIKLTPSRVVKFLGKLQQLEVADVMSALQRNAEIVIKIGGIIHEWRQAPEITPQSSPEVEDDICMPKLAPREDNVVSPELAPREEEALNKSHHHRLGGVLDKVEDLADDSPEEADDADVDLVPLIMTPKVSEDSAEELDASRASKSSALPESQQESGVPSGHIDDILERLFGDLVEGLKDDSPEEADDADVDLVPLIMTPKVSENTAEELDASRASLKDDSPEEADDADVDLVPLIMTPKVSENTAEELDASRASKSSALPESQLESGVPSGHESHSDGDLKSALDAVDQKVSTAPRLESEVLLAADIDLKGRVEEIKLKMQALAAALANHHIVYDMRLEDLTTRLYDKLNGLNEAKLINEFYLNVFGKSETEE
ncbi:hypothetical protein C7M84_015656 [Penaeus vannamei]|uniref:Uncharacterized protein n=1 Tax=Penaeus vannamei TaxID=6689 RepID=A0A423SQ23_PENVA|nr:hypothetical protein C7M84_015656 [Penaeus vannamei]